MAYVGTSILLVVTHYLGGLLVIAELVGLVVVLVRQRASRRLTGTVIVTLIAIGVVSLIGAWLNMPALTQSVGVRFVPLFELLRDLLNSFSLGLSVDLADWYVVLMDLLFLLLLVLGFIQLMRQQRRAAWLLVGYLLLPILFLYLLSYVRPAYMTSRHLILVTPAFYLLVSAGLAPTMQLAGNPAGKRCLASPATLHASHPSCCWLPAA